MSADTLYWVWAQLALGAGARTDDILSLPGGRKIAPMSLYKVLEEVKSIRRFQLVQRAEDRMELRILADDRPGAFEEARHKLQTFFESKGLSEIEVYLSEEAPQADKTSGKFKHIYAEFR